MAKLFVLAVLIALVSAEGTPFFIKTVDGGCGFTAGGTFINFAHDKDRMFVSSVHAYDTIESMRGINATFDITSSVMPCKMFDCEDTFSKTMNKTHVCLRMEVGIEGSDTTFPISFPVSDDLLSLSNPEKDGATYDAETESATLTFSVNLLANDAFKQTYNELKEALKKISGNDDTTNLEKVIRCIGNENPDSTENNLNLKMIFNCGNPQTYSDKNVLVFKYDENRMFPEKYDTAEDGVTFTPTDVCTGYTKYYTYSTCSNPNSPDVKGNQVNVKENGLSAGGVVGIVVACVVVVAAVAVVAIFFILKKTAAN